MVLWGGFWGSTWGPEGVSPRRDGKRCCPERAALQKAGKAGGDLRWIFGGIYGEGVAPRGLRYNRHCSRPYHHKLYPPHLPQAPQFRPQPSRRPPLNFRHELRHLSATQI